MLYHYFQFHRFLQSINLAPRWDLDRYGLNYGHISYALIIVGIFYFIYRYYAGTLPPRKIFLLKDLLEELLDHDLHSELVKVIEDNNDDIFKAYNSDYKLSKIKKRLSGDLTYEEIAQEISTGVKIRKPKWFISMIKSLLHVISKVIPEYDDIESGADYILESVYYRDETIRAIIKFKPYLGLKILDSAQYRLREFNRLYFQTLIADRESSLYFEIKRNQFYMGRGRRLLLDKNSKILNYLLKDASVAEKLQVWKPMGDFIIDDLKNRNKQEIDDYNRIGHFNDDESMWREPLFIFIKFYDIMVLEALYQNVQWHMWLYYFDTITRYISNNVHPPAKQDTDTQEDTVYEYFLYIIFSQLIGWIEEWEHVPKENTNKVVSDPGLNAENNSITKSSMICLSRCCWNIYASEKIPSSKKVDLV